MQQRRRIEVWIRRIEILRMRMGACDAKKVEAGVCSTEQGLWWNHRWIPNQARAGWRRGLTDLLWLAGSRTWIGFCRAVGGWVLRPITRVLSCETVGGGLRACVYGCMLALVSFSL